MKNVCRLREGSLSLYRLVVGTMLCLAGLAACGADPRLELMDDDAEVTYDLTAPVEWAQTLRRCGAYSLGDDAPLRTCVVPAARVLNFGEVVYEGEVDITACVSRVVAGMKLPFHHDGTVFRNMERRLPREGAGYYHEYVDPTPGVSGPGPQRIVRGEPHEWWYTPDHYATFFRVACSL
ncbi:MAG TPA: ribonuclease domain-containing protein [Myxococcota bacterium]|nr:ribonuclease domain-containing protein [Myxococcota bacterium]